MNMFLRNISIAILSSLATFAAVSGPAIAAPVSIDQLGAVRGIAIDPASSEKILLATRNGLFSASSDGAATRVSDLDADITALAVDPTNVRKLFISGQGKKGENLGVQVSTDGGVNWRRVSVGRDGAASFRALSISPKNLDVLYGVNDDLQVSRDGGLNWETVGEAPERLFALSVSAHDENTLFAATMNGLLLSRDGGRNWKSGYFIKQPATLSHITPTGRQFAFIYGTGLVETQEPSLSWKTVLSDFQDRVLMGMVVSPDDPTRLYGYSDTGAAMTSSDSGATWTSFEGSARISAKSISRGKELYAENCAACHGEGGIGERPDKPDARDEFGFVAPALNDDAHAWHHPDQQLVETILNGSDRNKRMIAWKDSLTREDVENIVTYVKSLWSFRSLACQGARHMACMR